MPADIPQRVGPLQIAVFLDELALIAAASALLAWSGPTLLLTAGELPER